MSSRAVASRSQSSKAQSSKDLPNADAPTTHDEGVASTSDASSQSENEFRPKRGKMQREELTEAEYIMVAKDIMSKPPFSGYLKYHLPLRYAARCEEVRWTWQDPGSGRPVYKDLIGGGRNSDLEYD